MAKDRTSKRIEASDNEGKRLEIVSQLADGLLVSHALRVKTTEQLVLLVPILRDFVVFQANETQGLELMTVDDVLHDRWRQQGEAQQFVDRALIQPFLAGNVGSAGDPAFVEQLLPMKRTRQRGKDRRMVPRRRLRRRHGRHYYLAPAVSGATKVAAIVVTLTTPPWTP